MSRDGRALIGTFGVILLFILVWLGWRSWEHSRLEKAREAVVDACLTRNVNEYARQVVELKAVVRQVGYDGVAEASFSQQLQVMGCKY